MKLNPFPHLTRLVMDMLSRFSVQQEDVVGVDITPSYTRVAQLSQRGGRWALEKVGYKYLEDAGEPADILNHPERYAQKLREIAAASKLSTANAAVSIPLTSAIIRVISLPLMTDEEIRNAIALDSLWENVVQISDSLDEYSVFWQIIRRDAASNTMDILFVASKLADINAYSNIVSAAGLNPVLVDVRCFAIRNALAMLPSAMVSAQASTILEIGLHENYLLVVKNDAPFIADLYLSETDRALLRSGERDEQILAALCERYATQVRQAVRAFKSRDPAAETGIEQIRVTSSLPHIREIVQMLGQKLQEHPLVLFDATEFVAVPEQLKAKVEAEQNRSVFTAVLGLATRKLDVFGYYKYVTGVNNINLLPNREAIRQTEKTKVVSKFAIVLVALLIALGAGFTLWRQSATEEALAPQVAEVERAATELDGMKNRVAHLESQRKAYQLTMTATAAFRSAHAQLEGALRAITDAVPRGVRLTMLVHEGGETLRIEGEAPNEHQATIFLEKLNAGGVLQRATLLGMGSEGEAAGIKFRFNCTLKPPAGGTAGKPGAARGGGKHHGS